MTAKSYPFDVRHKDVWYIALPTALAFVTEPLLGIADTTIVGRLGEVDLLGGLLLGGLVFDFMFAFFYFLRMSVTGLTAQAFGARDQAKQTAQLVRGLAIGLFAGLLIILLGGPLANFAKVVYGASDAVNAAFDQYFYIRLLAAPFALMNFVLAGWFLGRGQSITALMLQAGLNLTNIVLSYVLVFEFDMGIAGVAWGTVIATGIFMVIGLFGAIQALGGFSQLARRLHEANLFDKAEIKKMLSLSSNILLRSVLINAVFSFFAREGAQAGDVILATNGILLHFLMIASFFLDGLAAASEQLCGKAIGARWKPAFFSAIKLSSLWGFILSGCLSVIFILTGPMIIDFMTTSDIVRQTARDFLWLAALAPVFGVLAFVLDGVFAGAAMGSDMRNGMFLSAIAFLIIWAIAVPLFGIYGLWLALHGFFIARSAIFLWLLLRRVPSLFKEETPEGATAA